MTKPVGAAPNDRIVSVARWVARVWGGALLLVWGAFFIEHLDWFRDPKALPPAGVMLLQGCHLLLLAGLAIGWKRELAGGILVLASAVAFFAFTAGRSAPLFLGVTAVPAVIWIVLDRTTALKSAGSHHTRGPGEDST